MSPLRPRLEAPIHELWRCRIPNYWAMAGVAAIGDVGVAASLGTVSAFSMRDGAALWSKPLERGHSGHAERNRDRSIEAIHAVGGVFVVTSGGGWNESFTVEEARIVGLTPEGELRWQHDLRAGRCELLSVEGSQLELATQCQVTGQGTTITSVTSRHVVDVERGRLHSETLPGPRVTRCDQGLLYVWSRGERVWTAPDELEDIEVTGVYLQRAGATTAELLVPLPTTWGVDVRAVGDVVVVIAAQRHQKNATLTTAWSLRDRRELWRRDDLYGVIDVTERGILAMQDGDRPVLAELGTGTQIFTSDAIEFGDGATTRHAGDVVVCASAFELRLLDPSTGKVVQSVELARSTGLAMLGHDGLLVLACGDELICFADSRPRTPAT